ncbi:hypothetical protein BC834DRAFT_301052 [Gloeopeniophorella convolvens]|nr:hypothetical protein BC834DRAFT_301052 [Gloeopeniophorella convolvens]
MALPTSPTGLSTGSVTPPSDLLSPSTTSMSTLEEELTSVTNGAYPATELIRHLIQAVGHDVVSFRRNAQVSYMLVDRAREICEQINDYIHRTEGGQDWDSFEKYTNAIDPIEDTLFKLIPFTEIEKSLYLAGVIDIENCIASTESWATNREHLWSTLNALETTEQLKGLFSDVDEASRKEDRDEARRHDDRVFLEEVIQDFKKALAPIRRVPPVIRDVGINLENLLLKVAEGTTPSWLTVYAIKSGMLVQGVMDIMLKSTTISVETRNHLKSKTVWDAAHELAKLLNSTTGDDQSSKTEVRLKYNAFLALLRQITELELPKSYIELMKQAGRIRRPFHAQAVALIFICRFLAEEFEKPEHHIAENFLSIEDAFDHTLTALKAVVDAVTEISMFDLDKFEEHSAAKALASAQAQVKSCFDAFNISSQWDAKEQTLVEAKALDKRRMEDLNAALTVVSTRIVSPIHLIDFLTMNQRSNLTAQDASGSHIKVAITVLNSTGNIVLPRTEESFEESARLRAVRWAIAGKLPSELVKQARLKGQFQHADSKASCALISTVSELAGGASVLELNLTIA